MRARGLLALTAALIALCTTGCRVARPSDLPRDADWIVAVKSCRVPDSEAAIARFAHHAFFDLKLGDEDHWVRIEVENQTSGVKERPISSTVARTDRRWGDREVRVLQRIEGERARALAPEIRRVAKGLAIRYADGYRAWPGPNSNTLLAEIAREVPDLAFALHHNAVGKDYAAWLRADWALSQTGVRVDTLPLGFTLALREGVELHFLQLTLGISLWPPRLELPFLPEIPWARPVAPPALEMPDTPCWFGFADRSDVRESTTTQLLSTDGTIGIVIDETECWAHVTYTAVRDGEGNEIGGFRVIVHALDSTQANESTKTVRFEENRAHLWEGDLAGRHITLEILREDAGRLSLRVSSSDRE